VLQPEDVGAPPQQSAHLLAFRCGVSNLEGKVRPLRKLCGEQPDHERHVEVHLLGMHLATGHDRAILDDTLGAPTAQLK
jgi:hypothetical protein